MGSLLVTLLLLAPAAPQNASDPIVVGEVLAIGPVGERSRSPGVADAVLARLARGTWRMPQEGETLAAPGGRERKWERFTADADGWFSGRPFRGGWAVATIDVPTAGSWCLAVNGAASVHVDGAPHAGDVYRLGITRVPLWLQAGAHELLFQGGRGRMRAVLEPSPAPCYLEERDPTLPDVLTGQGGEVVIGYIVANATAATAGGLVVVAVTEAGEARSAIPPLGPSSSRKCAVRVPVPAEPENETLLARLSLVDADGAELHASEVRLAVRSEDDKHARTFVSGIDGSVQYFAVTPPDVRTVGERTGLVLTLHGASVEARNQANAYAHKTDVYIVAPTNRRPYGFDWEDAGRLDAIEVLDLACSLFDVDPRRVWLTGHSMGGHGTWQVGAHFPDRFAAIAPSAGWRDFWSYGGGGSFPEDDAIGALLQRAANTSRTALLERNYLSFGVYVLHGDADDNVPVREARAMRERLGAFHPNFAYYERPGAGHWWGNECVDWPPLFDFLERNFKPELAGRRTVEFVTVNPAVSSRNGWIVVEAQERWLEPSRVVARIRPEDRRIDLELENVTRIALDLTAFATAQGDAAPLLAPGGPVRLDVGDRRIDLAFDDPRAPLRLARGPDGSWAACIAPPPRHKGPHRAGPFKAAFDNRMVFVHGTQGSAEENAWAYAKARYDHETWRYRGNGAVDVIADVDFDPAAFTDRNVILYGHRELNAAWSKLLADAAFDVQRGMLRIGDVERTGDDLALLAVHPRGDSDLALVAVIAGTGMPGMRTTDDLPYFVSGVAYPDWTVLDASFLEHGLSGVLGAGFFRDDWSLADRPDTAWRD